MAPKNNEHLITECKQIEDDCKYTAEAHHTIASGNEKMGLGLKIIPAGVAAGSGVALLSGYPSWVAWLAIISGVVFAMTTIMGPDKRANDHTKAAKDYTVLKHDARALYQTFSHEMSQSEFYLSVRLLRERYNNLVSQTPKTTDKAFEKARLKVKSDRHTPDFEKQSGNESRRG